MPDAGHAASVATLGPAERDTQTAVRPPSTAGDLEGAGRAKLSIIEEFGEKIPIKELVAIYRSAIELLKHLQDPSTGKRLMLILASAARPL